MRPFCGALNRLSAGRVQTHALFLITVGAKVAIMCWRAMLYLVTQKETEFTRTLASFFVKHPTCRTGGCRPPVCVEPRRH